MAYNEDIFPLWIQRLNNLPPVIKVMLYNLAYCFLHKSVICDFSPNEEIKYITISPNYVNLH